jgi:hypothetical protein
MSLLSFLGVDSFEGRPYMSAIAEAAARKRGDDEASTEKQKKFCFSGFQFPVSTES